MRATTPQKRQGSFRSGMTLIELTVVILVLLSLISILFIGARAWKRGSDRAGCIVHHRNVQQALRSYQNLNAFNPGQDLSPINLQDQLIGTDKFVEATPQCPGGGTYSYGGNTLPLVGTLYLTCDLAGSLNHVPDDTSAW